VCPDSGAGVERPLLRAAFGLTATATLAGPWFFGAWVPWWFWPFAGCIFVSLLLTGLLLLLRSAACGTPEPRPAPVGNQPLTAVGSSPALLWATLALVAVTLAYVAIRVVQAPVRLDAERSLLLFLLPVAVGLQAAFVFDAGQRRLLLRLLFADFLLLGLYGIANHWITGSRLVLWMPGYAQYQIGTDRATGSYFCPDHFAGIMEIGLALGLALLLARGHGWRWYAGGGALSVVAVAAIAMSKSRGAGFAVAAMVVFAAVLGFYQRSTLKRWCLRVGALAALAIAAGVLWQAEPAYVQRFKAYFGDGALAGHTWREKAEALRARLEPGDRYQMISAALRGWRMSPVAGIGAGMHQHYWPHNAASGDGDRASNRWPKHLNNTYHSYEAHSDWAQLLEEYGLAGFVLVLAATGALFILLARSLVAEGLLWRRYGKRGVACAGVDPYALPLAGMLALVAMSVHSLGDFNLQMPATGWCLAALVAIPLARVAPRESRSATCGKENQK
jgi:O-antigen ligase